MNAPALTPATTPSRFALGRKIGTCAAGSAVEVIGWGRAHSTRVRVLILRPVVPCATAEIRIEAPTTDLIAK